MPSPRTTFRVEPAPPTWVDRLDADEPACVALAVLPGDDTAVVVDPDGIADRLGVDAAAALAAEKATGDAGQTVSVPVGHDGVARLLLVGVGDRSASALRKASAAVVRRSGGCRTIVASLASGVDAERVRVIAEAARLSAYSFDRRGGDREKPVPRRLLLSGIAPKPSRGFDTALASAEVVGGAVCFARDLANTPSLEKSPAWLASQASKACAAAGVSVVVRDEKALAAEGFGGILGVGAGSSRPPRLVEMTWSPPDATKHFVLIGKGITFDSGGLSLKPTDSMVAMKTDMAGGAAVIATMTALRDLGVVVKVTGLVPMAENLPGADATRPGDVLRHWGGRTSEVLNTDAEGRLVLADAIAYAASLKPDAIVDIATLTGAASLGLGRRHGAFYATNDRLRRQLLAASAAAGERLWSMPLVEDYRDSLESPIADLRNIAAPSFHYSGGSIVAALFLREFTEGLPWAHLDVAGPARADGDEAEISKGATGFGVRTFCRWLESAR